MLRVTVKPELLRWACDRSGRSVADLSGRFPKLALWETGEAKPTLKQLEDFAKATYVPIGYLFLPEPPEETIPIPDLRTIGLEEVAHPSPDLLDTLYVCQQRQAWYREFARSTGGQPLRFVGSADRGASVQKTGEAMRRALGFGLEARRQCPTSTEALRYVIDQADERGVLVMCSSVVGNNNTRKLDVEEFRGFALADAYAPLVFINGADTKAAQMFTLAHELAHIWLGESALSDVGPATVPTPDIEIWCNRVAAELLVPLEVIRRESPREEPLQAIQDLARRFKVSTLVIIRRIFDAKRIDWGTFQRAYAVERARLRALPRGSGGNFYLTQAARVGTRFARALVGSTLEGHTLYRDAFQMLGIKKEQTFREFGRNLGYGL